MTQTSNHGEKGNYHITTVSLNQRKVNYGAWVHYVLNTSLWVKLESIDFEVFISINHSEGSNNISQM